MGFFWVNKYWLHIINILKSTLLLKFLNEFSDLLLFLIIYSCLIISKFIYIIDEFSFQWTTVARGSANGPSSHATVSLPKGCCGYIRYLPSSSINYFQKHALYLDFFQKYNIYDAWTATLSNINNVSTGWWLFKGSSWRITDFFNII